jgi:hypothetical protein
MSPTRVLAPLTLALLAVPAAAQPRAGKTQPDKIAFGTVYAGATVEASFLVYEPGADPKIKFEVTAPKFVKVVKKETDARQFGNGNDFIAGTVELALDTKAAGDLSGDFEVTLGDSRVKVPVSATVKAKKKGYSRVLVADSPFHSTSTEDGGMFKTWTDLVAASPLDVSYVLVRPGKSVLGALDPAKFDCVFLDGGGVHGLTADDMKALRQYVEGGGRVVVSANYFFRGSVGRANEVLADSGIQMRDVEARGVGQNEVTIGKDDLHPRLAKDRIESVTFHRASPAQVTDDKLGRVLVKAAGVGEPGDGFVALGTLGKGEVIAIGQSLWWYWITPERAKGADNAKLLRWLLIPKGGA